MKSSDREEVCYGLLKAVESNSRYAHVFKVFMKENFKDEEEQGWWLEDLDKALAVFEKTQYKSGEIVLTVRIDAVKELLNDLINRGDVDTNNYIDILEETIVILKKKEADYNKNVDELVSRNADRNTMVSEMLDK